MMFYIAALLFYICTNCVQVFQFLHILSNTGFFFFSKVAILIRMRWYFNLVLIYLSIVIHEVEHFSRDDWPLCKSSL